MIKVKEYNIKRESRTYEDNIYRQYTHNFNLPLHIIMNFLYFCILVSILGWVSIRSKTVRPYVDQPRRDSSFSSGVFHPPYSFTHLPSHKGTSSVTRTGNPPLGASSTVSTLRVGTLGLFMYICEHKTNTVSI